MASSQGASLCHSGASVPPAARIASGLGISGRAVSLHSLCPPTDTASVSSAHSLISSKSSTILRLKPLTGTQSRRRLGTGARASVIQQDGPVVERWWEKEMPSNMRDLHSTQEFVAALGEAGEKLVVVEFFGTWCGSCRALYPKLCKLAAQYPDVMFYKIDFDENKPLCKSLNIRVLPFFHFYRGASGRLETFSCSISKQQRLKDALAIHSTERCSLGPPAGPEQVLHPDLVPEAEAGAPR